MTVGRWDSLVKRGFLTQRESCGDSNLDHRYCRWDYLVKRGFLTQEESCGGGGPQPWSYLGRWGYMWRGFVRL